MNPFSRSTRLVGLVGIASFIFVFVFAYAAAAQTSVITYHNDNYRTGWNSTETVLTPASVNASQFGLLATVVVDDEVDVQPLVVPGVKITVGNYQGVHDVLYVVTANNTVYAIDANAGTVLLTTNLGTPVSEPLGCKNSGPNVGVNSTPVIDPASQTLYLIAYTEGNTGPAYTLHALNLGNLTDTVTPQVVSAAHTLTSGTSFVFNATYQRQRPALLEANGNIYAGFGSFCDFYPALSRGWVLGWNATTLAPLPANQVLQKQATDQDNFFLASVWMSGWGLAADDSGNVLFVTGNSDRSGTAYDGVTSIEESVISVTPDLTTVVDLFTPDNWPTLDEHDTDFGAGGVMVLPDQPGSVPHLAAAAGKDGHLYFMNEDDLGGYSPTTNNVLATKFIGRCWCGPSYFVHSGAARLVTSGADTIKVFKVDTSTTPPELSILASAKISTGQDVTGFFTSVSSNGSATPIVWAVSRPLSKTQPPITLYAFDPNAPMNLLFSSVAGQWPYYTGRYNLPPTVANGRVYVASNQQLNIFGFVGKIAQTSGDNQTGQVGKKLPTPLRVKVTDAYTGNPMAGITINFSDGGQGGSFSNPNAVTNSQGFTSTNYILPDEAGVYTITASHTGFITAHWSETATAAP